MRYLTIEIIGRPVISMTNRSRIISMSLTFKHVVTRCVQGCLRWGAGGSRPSCPFLRAKSFRCKTVYDAPLIGTLPPCPQCGQAFVGTHACRYDIGYENCMHACMHLSNELAHMLLRVQIIFKKDTAIWIWLPYFSAWVSPT